MGSGTCAYSGEITKEHPSNQADPVALSDESLERSRCAPEDGFKVVDIPSSLLASVLETGDGLGIEQ